MPIRQEFLMMADGAEATNGKIYILGGGADRHLSPGFPTMLNADIAVGILVPWGETNMRHAMQLRIVDEDEGEVARVDTEFGLGRPATAVVGQELRFLIAIKGPFPIPHAGGFRATLALGGVVQEPPFRFWVEQAELGTRAVTPE